MSNTFLILIGTIAGLWLTLSKGTFFLLLSALLIFLVLKNFIPEKDRPFILKIIFIGFILRVALMLLYYYFYLGLGNEDILGPDGEIYVHRGWYISRILLDQNLNIVPNTKEYIFKNWINSIEHFNHKLPPVNSYQTGLFTYLIGILYSIFDYSPFLIRLINSMFSILTGVVIYFIGKEVFNSKIGRASVAFFIFLPSIYMFSITSLRDVMIIFLLTFVIWLIMKFQKGGKLLWLILTVVALVALGTLRFRIACLLAIAMAMTLFLCWRAGFLKKTIFIMIISMMFLLYPPFVKEAKHIFNQDNLFSGHIGYVNTPGNNYKIFPDRCYFQSRLVGVGHIEITVAFIKSIFHLLCEPLPFRVNNKILFFAFFQNILIYPFIPFAIAGLIISLRYRFYQMMALTMYLIICIPFIAINEGNVGTVFRHRDMLMPFLIILGIAGYYATVLRESPVLK